MKVLKIFNYLFEHLALCCRLFPSLGRYRSPLLQHLPSLWLLFSFSPVKMRFRAFLLQFQENYFLTLATMGFMHKADGVLTQTL
jgi:hypothetical protein